MYAFCIVYAYSKSQILVSTFDKYFLLEKDLNPQFKKTH